MENTNNKSFVTQNSDKPFIRTMEDDLKKIKSGAASGGELSSMSSEVSFPATPREIRRAAPAPGSASIFSRPAPTPAPVSAPAPVSVSAPVPASMFAKPVAPAPAPIVKPAPAIPGNLPIGEPLVEEEISKLEEKLEIAKPIEMPVSRPPIAQPVSRPVIPPIVKPVMPPIARPVPPAVPTAPVRRAPRVGALIDDVERLSPEARLARQSSLGINGDEEARENLMFPPTARASSNISRPPSRFERPAGIISSSSAQPQNAFSAMDEKKRSIEEIIKEDTSDSFLKKFIKLFLVFLIIIGVGVGAYYFYISRKTTPPAPFAPLSETYITGATEVNIITGLNSDFNNDIGSYFSNPMPSGIYRVILKDRTGNSSLGLENFKKNLNITLPDSVLNAVEKDYNLIVFNYPERKYLRLGLVFKPKKAVDILGISRKWEFDMYKNVESIFLRDTGVFDPGKQFGTNSTNGFTIRYLPLGADSIALNYAIDNENNFLLIATSKDDIFSLIDKIIRKN